MKKVQILMSTYNGEKYLKEQLDSLLEQNYPNISILIRDDGSSDNTKQILEQYKSNYENIQYYCGKNIGCWQSFMDLIKNCSTTTDYFAFCDQDDYWERDKISSAVEKLDLMNQDVPLLYCSRLKPVGKDLQDIRVTIKNINFRPSFGNAVIQNICTGCTAVFNRIAVDFAKDKEPRFMVQQDWWFYLIAACYGEVCYDDIPHILYRQHGNNEVGARTTQIEQLKYRIRNYKSRRGNIYKQLEEFERVFDLPIENREKVDLVLSTKGNMKKRIQMVTDKSIYRQKISDDLIYKVIILIGDA